MNKEIFIFLQKNYGWIVALLTGASVIMSFVLRFIKYIYSILYFDYYGISYGLFDTEELSFLYDFGLSILMISCFFSLFYCYKQLYDLFVNKIEFYNLPLNIFLIITSNFFLVLSLGISIISWQFLINMLLLIPVEVICIIVPLIFSRFVKVSDKIYDNLNNKKIFLFVLKIIPFYFLLLLIIFSLNYLYTLKNINKYEIINNDKVIVYTSKDYYLVLNCKIDNDKLTIYKGNQTKINNENVESKLIKFDEIEIK